jgi:RNA polymerase sigma factor (sigma-70 family)
MPAEPPAPEDPRCARRAPFPATSPSLLSMLKADGRDALWQVSWKRFLELYYAPLEAAVRTSYRRHTGGGEPSPGFVEDAVADTVVDFFTRSQFRFDRDRGRLRTFLRTLANARVVDRLRKERPLDHQPLADCPDPEKSADAGDLPPESQAEAEAFRHALLATLVEDLRNRIPLRQFEVFERVKLKHQSPQSVAEDLGLRRAMVDRYVHKAMTALRRIARQSDYLEEFHQSFDPS